MTDQTPHSGHSGLEFMSVLVGFGAGILGTLVYATYKQNDFDRIVDKTRDLAANAEDRVIELGDRADGLNRKVTTAAHKEVDMAHNVAKNAIDSVRHVVSDHAMTDHA